MSAPAQGRESEKGKGSRDQTSGSRYGGPRIEAGKIDRQRAKKNSRERKTEEVKDNLLVHEAREETGCRNWGK